MFTVKFMFLTARLSSPANLCLNRYIFIFYLKCSGHCFKQVKKTISFQFRVNLFILFFCRQEVQRLPFMALHSVSCNSTHTLVSHLFGNGLLLLVCLVYLCIYLFLLYWGLNPEPPACQASILPLSHTHPSLPPFIFETWSGLSCPCLP